MIFRILALTALAVASGVALQPALAQHRADEAARARQLDPKALETRLKSVGILIEKSSAANHLKGNGALDSQRKAEELHEQAVQAYQAGDYAKASDLLGQAYKLVFSTTRQTAPEDIIRKKQQQDFDRRLASTRAMLDAQRHVNSEKSSAEATGHIEQVAKLLVEAEQVAKTDLDKAMSLVEKGYLIAKASVGQMRQGDTLVRSLDFATKAEEYKYELDRNDSHQNLVKMLLQDRKDNPETVAAIEAFVERARQMRVDAEEKAAAGEYESAIERMEAATRELVQGIRAAGIFIPG